MRAGRRILVVVPARGGSKGVPLKNLQPVGGRPLVTRVGEVVAELEWVDRAVVSTDHLLIREAAMAAGLEAPFLRPPALSGDRIGDVEVLAHALGATEEEDGRCYDAVVMLQPTSPLRTAAHVTATIDKLLEESLDAVWTVSRTDSKAHPLKQLVIGADGRLDYFDARGESIIARQQLEPVFHRNGVAYVLTRECLLEQRTLLGRRAAALLLDEELVSIDTPEDLERADLLLASRSQPRSTPNQARPRRLVVDIDGVLAAARMDTDYAAAEPMADNIARLNALHDAGCEIVLFTARGSATGQDWTGTTRDQLARWGVRYHALAFGKPHADYYIDDRALGLCQALAMCGIRDPVD